jgi:hypothetical protein
MHNRTRKPREKPVPYKRRSQTTAKNKDAPTTSAKPDKITTRKNLTLNDWLTVFAYIDTHPNQSQAEIVAHFEKELTGALAFSQSALSRAVKRRAELEARVDSNPNALSSKRPRIVTRPDVEQALFKWVKHMEVKGETVNGPMLRAKRAKFEEEFDVPKEERLSGDGWVSSFCRTYKIREHRRHGEAGSVDLDAVAAQRIQCQKILAKYSPKDRWNFDETSFFPL